jgi:hypothetical protein
MAKTHLEKVEAAVIKKPRTGTEIANKVGYATHHGVGKALGQLVREGKVVRTEKGYVKATQA